MSARTITPHLAGPVRNIELSGIAVIPSLRLRTVRPEAVNELAASMKLLGQLQPIILRPQEGVRYYLVAGWSRYLAAKQLRWFTIRASIVEGMGADQALLAEIAENLHRAELTVVERAEHIAEWIRLTKEQSAQVAPKGPIGHRPQGGSNAAVRELGIDRTEAQRSVKIASITPEAKDAAHEAGLDDNQAALLRVGASRPESQLERVAREKEIKSQYRVIQRREAAEKKERRTEREASLAASTVAMSELLGTKLYSVIYADPPWRLEPFNRETGLGKAAANHYPTMTTEAIVNMEIPAADDCVLFLWATAPMLPDALEAMRAWGFTYKSNYIWAKDRIGTGYWSRNQHEQLLIGTRGKIPCPSQGTQPSSLIAAPVGRHSEKTNRFADIIKTMFPNLPALEMFARAPRHGWDAWGNEAGAAL
jgi:N6-adenosine-specific RNA methylase IME4